MSIKQVRENAGKTVLETAHALGVSPQAVYQWESGETSPSAENILKLANFHGCSADDLLRKEDNRTAEAVRKISDAIHAEE